MSSTMLQLIQQATGEMGLSVPSSVAGNQTQDVVQCLALLNAVGYELQRQFTWQTITKEYRFTTQFLQTTGTWTVTASTVTAIPTTAALGANTWMVMGTGIPQDCYIQSVDGPHQVTLSQTPNAAGTNATITFCQSKYAMPADFDRLIDRTNWDKSKHWEMLGPETPQQWQWLKSGYISTGPRIRFRPLGGYFQVWPMLGTNEYLGFEYVSNQWVLSVAAQAAGPEPDKASFTIDTDKCAFPDRLMVLGLKVKYFQAKGFDYSAFGAQYQAELSIAKADDAGAPTLSMAPRISQVLIGWENIPDSNYGT